MKSIIEKNYQTFGYVNIETPAVESTEVLTSKGGDEVGKQIFGLYGLKQWASDLKPYSLHFDLTVPFARYVVDNEDKLKFPFKRYQIQKVWRGERQQRGRYKEFIQADIDVVGNKLPLAYDSEIILTLARSLSGVIDYLQLWTPYEIHLNNKKYIDGICGEYGIEGDAKTKFFALLDNYYKLPRDKFESQMQELVPERYQDVLALLAMPLETLDDSNSFLKDWLTELKQVFSFLKLAGVNVVFDPYVTRGLDYYTGTVFETFLVGVENFWSVCSGGRYDNLVESIRKVANGGKTVTQNNYDWVGGSIGLSRFFWGLMDLWLITISEPLTQAIIFNTWGIGVYAESVAENLRQNGISTDVYYPDDKLAKQFWYAENKGIIYGIFAGEDEEQTQTVVLKNLQARTQETVWLEELIGKIIS